MEPWYAVVSPNTNKRYWLGMIFILGQCIVWIAAAIITQNIFRDSKFNSPFCMTYIGMSLMTLLLPAKIFTDSIGATEQLRISPTFDSLDLCYVNNEGLFSVIVRRIMFPERTKLWNHKRHFLAAVVIAPFMFIADWAFNTSLSLTSVGSATVLVSTQSIFVYLMASLLLRIESFSWMALFGVILSVGGTALTAVTDAQDEASGALRGDAVAMLASLAYAFYTVEVKWLIPEDEKIFSMQLLLGYIGLVCFVPLFPAFVTFSNNLTLGLFGLIVVKGSMDFLVIDYLMFQSILLTNATIATAGLGLTIPMALVTDYVLHGDFDRFSFFGAVLVSIGFVAVNLVGSNKEDGDPKDAIEVESEEPTSCEYKGQPLV
jgi:Permeases of the drug/metabolite transporter (DMT) superfamily